MAASIVRMAKCNIAIPPEMAPDLMTIFQNGSPRTQLYTEMGTELLLERDQVPRRDLNRFWLCWPAYLQQSARVI
jgi:hypothetical protein